MQLALAQAHFWSWLALPEVDAEPCGVHAEAELQTAAAHAIDNI